MFCLFISNYFEKFFLNSMRSRVFVYKYKESNFLEFDFYRREGGETVGA